ncbi:MAG TPA: MXAN_2562 family outer membrane beta-barrel protein [Polyangia bacterium]|jgi:hypothetical protein
MDAKHLGAKNLARSGCFVALLVAFPFAGVTYAQTTTITSATLASTDFTFTLYRVDSSGSTTALDVDTLATYFTAARCACPSGLIAALTLSTDGLTKLGSSSLDAQLMVGANCDDASAGACTSLGSTLTLSASKSSTQATLSSVDVFGGASCTGDATSTRVWAIVRVDGTLLATQPSLAVTLRGAGPVTPTAVTAQTADSGLLVSWTTTGDATTLQGHQVFCSPGPTSASTAAFETCDALPATASDNPFSTWNAAFICSDLVTVGTSSVRLKGLTNGTLYQVAVASVGIDGTPSAPSAVVTATPGPTTGFDDLYFQQGGTAQTGCSVAGPSPGLGAWGAAVVLLGVLLAARRSRRRRPAAARVRRIVTLLICLGAITAPDVHADDEFPATTGAMSTLALDPADRRVPYTPSPRGWNLELRFGPYRPDVDREFSARGSSARPYEQIFSSSRHLLFQLEVDRQLSHRGGTWAIGVTAGYTHAAAAALAADLLTRTGDETSLTLLPLSVSLVYRADILREYEGIGLIPYAKAGLDCTFWRMSDTSRTSTTDGKTLGWHAALGISLDLASFDPGSARLMDLESGVNQTALFLEVARYSLDGFGASSVLHVGDTTWLGGLMFEL